MPDYEKINIVLNDKRVQARSKLVISLLLNGFTLQEVINFPSSKIETLKEVENGERFFMQYALSEGTLERIYNSGLLFPSTNNNKPMQKNSILQALRRSCKINGYQLHQLQIDGLVSDPVTINEVPLQKSNEVSFDDIINLIKRK